MPCLFCRQDAAGGQKAEHIIPESIGGGPWCVLPPGVVCDQCNQYFGSKVERLAIADYPLSVIRVMNGVITKKRKWAVLPHHRGLLEARPVPGAIGIEPVNDDVERAILGGQITQFRVIAETRSPVLLCRMLLKIGLEMIAYDNMSNAFDSRYDAARQFARAPRTGSRWWFLYHGDVAEGLNIAPETKATGGKVIDLGGGEVAIVDIFDWTFLVPLTLNVIPENLHTLPEPEYRCFQVTG